MQRSPHIAAPGPGGIVPVAPIVQRNDWWSNYLLVAATPQAGTAKQLCNGRQLRQLTLVPLAFFADVTDSLRFSVGGVYGV